MKKASPVKFLSKRDALSTSESKKDTSKSAPDCPIQVIYRPIIVSDETEGTKDFRVDQI